MKGETEFSLCPREVDVEKMGQTTKAYLVEIVSEKSPMMCQEVQVVIARNAMEAVGMVAADGCDLMSCEWRNTEEQDRVVAYVRVDGLKTKLRASRWVS